MKFRNFLCHLLLVIPLVHLSICLGSYVSQADLVYWDVLSFTDNTLMTVDSKISALSLNQQTSCVTSFTVIQNVQNVYQSIGSLLSEGLVTVSFLESALQTVQSAVDNIASQIASAELTLNEIRQVDFGGTWTLIQGIQQTETSVLLQLSEHIDSRIDSLSDMQLVGFSGTSTMIALLSDSIAFNTSLLEILENFQASNIDSFRQAMMRQISLIDVAASTADIIDNELVTDCAGTATALNELNILIQNIFSIAASINSIDVSNTSTLDALYANIAGSNATLLSSLEVILADIETVNDLLNTTDSLVDTMSVTFSTVDSTIDAVIILTSTLIADVENMLETAASLNGSLAYFIESTVVPSESAFNLLENSIIQTLNTFIGVESNLDTGVATYNTITSTLDGISSQLFTDITKINSALNNAQLLGNLLVANQSLLDVNLNLYSTVNSALTVLDPTILSLIDQTATVNSKVNTLQSSIQISVSTGDALRGSVSILDRLSSTIGSMTNFLLVPLERTLFSEIDFARAAMPTIASMTSVVDSKIERAESKLVVIQNSTSTIVSNMSLLLADFEQTWTILNAMNRLPSTINSLASTLQSQLSVLATATYFVDFSGTFTALNALNKSFLSVESVISSIALKAPDTTGSFTVIANMNTDVTNIYLTLESVIDAMIDFTAFGAIGTPITTQLVGTTGYVITRPGKYYLAETINFAPTLANQVAVTINANNVYLDLAGKSLINAATLTNGVGGIAIGANMSNIIVNNGTISLMNGNNLVVGDNTSLITFRDLRIIEASSIGMSFSGSVANLLMQRVTFDACTSSGLSLVTGADIYIENCVFANNVGDGILISPGSTGTIQRMVIRKSSFLTNGGNGININGVSGGTQSKIIIDGCEMINNNGAGLRASQVIRSVFKNNVMTFNAVNGITLVNTVDGIEIFDNILVNNTGHGLQVTTAGSLPCEFMRNVFLLNSTDNYFEGASAGPHTLFGNYALQSTDAANYSITGGGTPTFVNKVIRHQGDSFIDNAEKWINISMLTT